MSGVDEQVLAARILLGWLVEPGSRSLHALVAKMGPVEALAHITSGPMTDRLAATAAARLGGHEPARIVDRLRRQAERLGVTIIVPESPQWPSALDNLVRISQQSNEGQDRDTLPPHVLWLRGRLSLQEAAAKCVAIVGARASTSYGEHVASEVAYDLAERGWTVISGGAFGIDAAAHRGALAADGQTIAVMACGVDRLYPSGNSGLLEHIAGRGLIVSEWPPGAAPHKVRFLIRNRVIAALSQGTVMVEASARSGARQTMRRARQMGRRTMAVPGPVTSEMSIGCHEELRRDDEDRVRLVTNAKHVLEEVGSIGGDLASVAKGPKRAYDSLSPLELQLVDATPRAAGATAEQIAATAGVPALYAHATLPALELRGYVRKAPDGTYRVKP